MDASGSSQTILVVDDDPYIREVLHTFLTHHGYQVLLASSGEDALQRSRSYAGPVGLVVTDLLMPGMTGQQLVQHLLVERPGMRVLYMSGYSEEGIAPEQARQALSLYLNKPFQLKEFLQNVQVLLA